MRQLREGERDQQLAREIKNCDRNNQAESGRDTGREDRGYGTARVFARHKISTILAVVEGKSEINIAVFAQEVAHGRGPARNEGCFDHSVETKALHVLRGLNVHALCFDQDFPIFLNTGFQVRSDFVVELDDWLPGRGNPHNLPRM
jgi:hypothetical protein